MTAVYKGVLEENGLKDTGGRLGTSQEIGYYTRRGMRGGGREVNRVRDVARTLKGGKPCRC